MVQSHDGTPSRPLGVGEVGGHKGTTTFISGEKK